MKQLLPAPRRAAIESLIIVLALTACTAGRTGTGESVVQLTRTGARNGQPSWSPDGRTIAFVSNRSGSWQVWLQSLDGSAARRLTDGPVAVSWPNWLPDGSAIVFERGRRFHRIVLGTGEVEPFTALDRDVFRPLPSPVGERLLFDLVQDTPGPNHDIHILDLRDGELSQLTSDPGYDSDARWSPAGDTIVFHSDRGADQFDTQVWLISSDGSGLRRLTDGPPVNGYPSWSPNGRCIVYTSELDGNRDLWLLYLEEAAHERLTVNPGFDGDPVWNPAGGSILFTTDRFGGEELSLLALESRQVRRCED